ncbi:hypothetical protein MNBD_ALPHA11-831 [hydrothermal vent metagenome]|uniref:Uncharacterized protein n=1 Tax=hydrothermal vent metagenome TaxID=652676 RepID=A0A3B0UHR5_9ZZZZ
MFVGAQQVGRFFALWGLVLWFRLYLADREFNKTQLFLSSALWALFLWN